mmetsp:Transcript_14684/g.46822  ORF Transcript_14684/g.46822 Transcript_14684/m.46822 type:complete len:495 (+) Transcript_14684:310-1794(+)
MPGRRTSAARARPSASTLCTPAPSRPTRSATFCGTRRSSGTAPSARASARCSMRSPAASSPATSSTTARARLSRRFAWRSRKGCTSISTTCKSSSGSRQLWDPTTLSSAKARRSAFASILSSAPARSPPSACPRASPSSACPSPRRARSETSCWTLSLRARGSTASMFTPARGAWASASWFLESELRWTSPWRSTAPLARRASPPLIWEAAWRSTFAPSRLFRPSRSMLLRCARPCRRSSTRRYSRAWSRSSVRRCNASSLSWPRAWSTPRSTTAAALRSFTPDRTSSCELAIALKPLCTTACSPSTHLGSPRRWTRSSVFLTILPARFVLLVMSWCGTLSSRRSRSMISSSSLTPAATRSASGHRTAAGRAQPSSPSAWPRTIPCRSRRCERRSRSRRRWRNGRLRLPEFCCRSPLRAVRVPQCPGAQLPAGVWLCRKASFSLSPARRVEAKTCCCKPCGAVPLCGATVQAHGVAPVDAEVSLAGQVTPLRAT